jgi:hypothetical protein
MIAVTPCPVDHFASCASLLASALAALVVSRDALSSVAAIESMMRGS